MNPERCIIHMNFLETTSGDEPPTSPRDLAAAMVNYRNLSYAMRNVEPLDVIRLPAGTYWLKRPATEDEYEARKRPPVDAGRPDKAKDGAS